MAFEFDEIPTSAGAFFKPGDHASDAALLIEVKRLESQRPGNYGPKDTIHGDVYSFETEVALDSGSPSAIIQGAIIQQAMLVRDLSGLVGKATVVRLEQVDLKNSPNKGWVWRKVSDATKAKVVAYAKKREEELSAAAEDAPAF